MAENRSPSSGNRGHVRPERPVTFLRNSRSGSTGIGGHVAPEYSRNRCTRRRILDQGGNRFAAVWGKRSNVDQAFDAWVVAGFGDDGAAVRMSHENNGAFLLGDYAFGRGHVVGQRGGRILHDADAIAVLLEDLVDAFPARSIDESAVNQNNRSPSGICIRRHEDLHMFCEVSFRADVIRIKPMGTFYADFI